MNRPNMQNQRNVVNPYVVYYSTKCPHSKNFFERLRTSPDLYHKFDKKNIDNKALKLPAYLKSVPTILVLNPGTGKYNIFEGDGVFNWLDTMTGQTRNQNNMGGGNMDDGNMSGGGGNMGSGNIGSVGPISDYDPSGMSGFSESFSYIGKGNEEKTTDKNFSYLNRSDLGFPSNVPQDGHLDNKNAKKDESAQALEKLITERNTDVPNGPMRVGGGNMPMPM